MKSHQHRHQSNAFHKLIICLLFGLASCLVVAQQTDNFWVRFAVPSQKVTGAFVTLSTKTPLRLVGAYTSVAEYCEIHEMKMVDQVMQMRQLQYLDLSPGKTELAPGGYHLMLFNLKRPLKPNENILITLEFLNDKKVKIKKTFLATVKAPE